MFHNFYFTTTFVRPPQKFELFMVDGNYVLTAVLISVDDGEERHSDVKGD